MKPITCSEAFSRMCPFMQDGMKCRGTQCMAFQEVHPRIEREDHSGGKEMIWEQASKRGYQKVQREGPPGSTGFFYLEALHVCERLNNNCKGESK